MYVRDISTGITVSNKEPVIETERLSTAHVNGCNLLGPVVGDFSMQLAINKAKKTGVGFVSAKSKYILFMSFSNPFSKLMIKLYICTYAIGYNPFDDNIIIFFPFHHLEKKKKHTHTHA